MDVSTNAGAATAAPTMAAFTLDRIQLANGSQFTTEDYLVARNYVEKTTHGLFDFSLRSAREFRQYDVSTAQLGGMLFSLVRVDSESGYDIEMTHDPDLILMQVLMRGSAQFQQGSAQANAVPSQMVLLETVARSHKRWCGPTQLLIVRLSRSRLERIVADETGVSIGEPLSFGVLQVLDLQSVSTLWNYIVTICRDLSESHPCFDGHVGRLAERTLALLLLNAVPNNYRWAFAGRSLGSAAPYYVRRVENYIKEHARSPISSDDLVAVGGVSARSIYQGFRRFRSTTPMGYLKMVRLELARDALCKGRDKGPNSVTEAAVAAGYTNLSQFSRDYKDRFRESPSQTLANA